MRLSPAPVRSRTRGARTATGPRPVMMARSGRWPWRTSRCRPSSVCLSAWPLRKAATSASTACANRARAPSRRTSVSGSENSAGWISLTTLSWIMAYHSFGGEVEVSNTPTIRRLIPHAVTNFRAYLDGKPVVLLAHTSLLVRKPVILGREGGDLLLGEPGADLRLVPLLLTKLHSVAPETGSGILSRVTHADLVPSHALRRHGHHERRAGPAFGVSAGLGGARASRSACCCHLLT